MDKNNDFYINKILSDLAFIIEHTKELSKEDILKNEILLDSLMFRIIQISENSKFLDENIKNETSTIKRKLIIGFRNRIVHDYGAINYSILLETVKDDIPKMYEILKGYINK